MHGIRDIVEQFDRKFNPSNTVRGRQVANRELAEAIGKLVASKKLATRDISFKALYEETFEKPYREELIESLDASAFPQITGQIVSKTVIGAYEAYPKQGLSLVQVIPGTVPNEEKVAGFTTVGTLQTVKPTESYQYITPPAEKFKRVTKIKRGGLLAISEDIIRWDRTGEYLGRAAGIGEEVARDQDERIMKGVVDFDSNVYDKGALFASPSSSGGTNGNAYSGADTLLDNTGWEKIDNILETKQDDKGRPIWVRGDKPILMVPAGLKSVARKLMLNEYGALGTANLDRNLAKDQFDVMVNPYISSPLSSAVWFYGTPKREFVWVEDIPLQVMQRGGMLTEAGWNNDIIVEHKVRYQGGIGATDTPYWYRMTGA